MTCNNEYLRSERDLAQATTELEECAQSVIAINNDLTQANNDVSSCNDDLATANTAVDSCNADLATANTAVSSCNSDLSAANDLVSDCQTALAASETVTEVPTLQSGLVCVDSDEWYFNTVASSVTLPDNHVMCVLEGEYAVRNNDNGNVYPTCVGYASDRNAVCDTASLMCGDSDRGIMGWPEQQADRVRVALMRNDFRHCDCPSIQTGCSPLTDWWKERFVAESTATQEDADNVCLNTETNELRYVSSDAWMNTCVGFSETPNDHCSTDRTYMCSSMDDGYPVYGYPGQISRNIGRALEAETKRHPYCPW